MTQLPTRPLAQGRPPVCWESRRRAGKAAGVQGQPPASSATPRRSPHGGSSGSRWNRCLPPAARSPAPLSPAGSTLRHPVEQRGGGARAVMPGAARCRGLVGLGRPVPTRAVEGRAVSTAMAHTSAVTGSAAQVGWPGRRRSPADGSSSDRLPQGGKHVPALSAARRKGSSDCFAGACGVRFPEAGKIPRREREVALRAPCRASTAPLVRREFRIRTLPILRGKGDGRAVLPPASVRKGRQWIHGSSG